MDESADIWSDISQNWSDENKKFYEDAKRAFALEGERIRLAKILRDRRKALGLSGVQLAKKLSMQPAEVSRILSGVSNPTMMTQIKLAEALEMRISFEPIEGSLKMTA
jgi:ribosome-binding protein aMBF1 (putative translation factor)